MYKSCNSDTYIVYGEAKVEDMNAPGHGFAMDPERAREAAKAVPESKAEGENEEAPSLVEAEEADEDVDETGVEAKDIDLVMQQANVSRAKAVKALKDNNNDIVNAIMVRFLTLTTAGINHVRASLIKCQYSLLCKQQLTISQGLNCQMSLYIGCIQPSFSLVPNPARFQLPVSDSKVYTVT